MLFDMDEFMRAAFVVEILGVFMIRSLFAGGLQIGEEKGRKWRESLAYLIGGIPLGSGFLWSFFFYLSSADLPWMYLGLPDLARWVGLIASFAASAFLIWVFKTIGTAGAKHIVTFDAMKLATQGPYTRVRHPMYLGFFLWSLTWLLFTDNWLVGVSFAGFIVFIAIFRVPHEERVLIAHFGDEYRQYMARTSRFLPLGSRKKPGSAAE
jgi:protein-S-isoprenylcysteine O-methyltransferase Ste14